MTEWPLRSGSAPFRTVAERKVYASPWWSVEEHDVLDAENHPAMFNVLHGAEGVTVLAAEGGCVHLIREYKYAIADWTLQLCSGSVDAGETPLQAAKRELREEVGLVARSWQALGRVHPYPTNIVDAVHLFVARDIKQVHAPEQDIEVLTFAFAEIRSMIENGEITHAASQACLLRYVLGEFRRE